MRYATLVIILISGTAYAVPSISGLNGEYNHGSTVTVTGSGFGTRSDFGGASHAISDFLPVTWKDFEDDTLESDSLQVESNRIQEWIVEGTGAKSNSAKHGKRIFVADRVAGLENTQSGTTGNWFFSFWEYFPAISTLTMVDGGKQFRIYGSGNAQNIYLSSADDSTTFSIFSECIGCSPAPTIASGQTGGNKLGQWQRVDVAMMQDPDQFIVYRNMQKLFCMSSSTAGFTDCLNPIRKQYVVNPFGGNGHTYIYGHMHDSPAEGSGDGGYELLDDLYADYSLSHVELCNQSTWNDLITGGGSSTTAHCEIQIPTAWTNTAVTVDINTGSFASGTTVYAYVITENSTAEAFDVNPTGFAMLIGQSGTGGQEGGGGEEEEDDDPVSSDGVLIGYDAP